MIKREVDFGNDNFGKPKVLSQQESVAQVLINLLFLKPGQMPSLPHIGINIKKYLYQFDEKINTEAIKRQIINQCNTLYPYIDTSGLIVTVVKAMNDPVFVIVLPFSIADDGRDLVIVIKRDVSLGTITFNYEFQGKEII